MIPNARSHKAGKVVERMGKKLNRQLVGSLVGCVHCGMCTESCHYVLANPDDPTYAPAYKADQIRKIFKRNFDWTGKVFPWWVHAQDIRTDEDLVKLKEDMAAIEIYKTGEIEKTTLHQLATESLAKL